MKSSSNPFSLKLEDNKIIVSHPPQYHDAIFDLCDFNGKIQLSGDLLSEKKKTEIELNATIKGSYHFFIIDEGMVYKELITLN